MRKLMETTSMLFERYRDEIDVYVDLDGVVADFDSWVLKQYGRPLSELISTEEGKNKFYADYSDHILHHDLFNTLDTLPGAVEMIMLVLSDSDYLDLAPEILSAAGQNHTEIAMQQKREWCARNLPGIKVNLVTHSTDKAKYAHPKAILIDDRMASIGPWRDAGGIGILHKNVQDTLISLKGIIDYNEAQEHEAQAPAPAQAPLEDEPQSRDHMESIQMIDMRKLMEAVNPLFEGKQPCLNPCPECPYRKDSMPNDMGGHSPEEYKLNIVREGPVSCHMRSKFDDEEQAIRSKKTGEYVECTGRVLSQMKSYHTPRDNPILMKLRSGFESMPNIKELLNGVLSAFEWDKHHDGTGDVTDYENRELKDLENRP